MGGWLDDPKQSHYGCFLPDLTGLVRASSAASLPHVLYHIWWADSQERRRGRFSHLLLDSAFRGCPFEMTEGMGVIRAKDFYLAGLMVEVFKGQLHVGFTWVPLDICIELGLSELPVDHEAF